MFFGQDCEAVNEVPSKTQQKYSVGRWKCKFPLQRSHRVGHTLSVMLLLSLISWFSARISNLRGGPSLGNCNLHYLFSPSRVNCLGYVTN